MKINAKRQTQRRIGGHLIFAIGIIHTLVGLIVFIHPTLEIINAGFINGVTLEPHLFTKISSLGLYPVLNTIYPRMAAFWFFWSGFAWMILGSFSIWFEHHLNRPTPRFIGWALLAYGLGGMLILPVSGFCLLILVSLYLIYAARDEVPLKPSRL